MHKTLLIVWLTHVQNIFQSSFVDPLDVVCPRNLPTRPISALVYTIWATLSILIISCCTGILPVFIGLLPYGHPNPNSNNTNHICDGLTGVLITDNLEDL